MASYLISKFNIRVAPVFFAFSLPWGFVCVCVRVFNHSWAPIAQAQLLAKRNSKVTPSGRKTYPDTQSQSCLFQNLP